MFSNQGFITWQSNLLMTYKHLSKAESYQIHVLVKDGHDQYHMAKMLDQNKSTISRELSRNTVIGAIHKGAVVTKVERIRGTVVHDH